MDRSKNTLFLSRAEKKQLVQSDGIKRTTFSFYKYFKVTDPVAFRAELLGAWGKLGCLGRIYVAKEGINAQMNVSTANFEKFKAFMSSQAELADIPFKIAVEEGNAPSFYKLTIKVRPKIVADGLDDASFDVTNTGAYLTAKEFNEYVDDEDAIIVDMRNGYESEIGHFESAVTPEVDTFREELAVTPKMLEAYKDKKVALYCTGGIRCEKASAWLKHNGFKDVRHLKGGIIDYKHQVEREGLENRFQGKNFVFDERLGERIGDEIISHCHLCEKEKSDQHYHCKNEVCHILFLGCEGCMKKYGGYCSLKCKLFDLLPEKVKKFYARHYNKYFRGTQFKKKRMKLKVL